MRIGSLFSGYGGLDLGALAVLGGEVAWHVEFDSAPSAILAHHWPTVPNYGDVTGIDWARVEPVDLLTAGYPCQPFSLSGQRKGSTDDRHLWPYVIESIRYLRPRIVLLENVRGHLSLGFDRVLGDLADVGYDARWTCIPASDAGAPHRRYRLFIVANPQGIDWRGLDAASRNRHEPRGGGSASADAGGERLGEHAGESPSEETWAQGGDLAESASGSRLVQDWGPYRPAIERWERILGRRAPAPRMDGRLAPRFIEWMMGLPEGWVTDPAIGLGKSAQAKALGNGVVPQHAALALRLLLPESHDSGADRG